MTPAEIRDVLREVVDPELGVNIVDLGLVYAIEVVDEEIHVTMTMTTPACPLRDYIRDLVESTLLDRLPGAQGVVVDIVQDPPWSEDMMSEVARRQLE
jgi:metal-sulfur cluster biosynthetic enzyme